jgi:hypothetical protein
MTKKNQVEKHMIAIYYEFRVLWTKNKKNIFSVYHGSDWQLSIFFTSDIYVRNPTSVTTYTYLTYEQFYW